ncbi:MAG: hypothetical protein Q4A28_00270 [Brachymonas sp.]|nr:hypothetical protein [Brachymonas sp.]
MATILPPIGPLASKLERGASTIAHALSGPWLSAQRACEYVALEPISIAFNGERLRITTKKGHMLVALIENH